MWSYATHIGSLGNPFTNISTIMVDCLTCDIIQPGPGFDSRRPSLWVCFQQGWLSDPFFPWMRISLEGGLIWELNRRYNVSTDYNDNPCGQKTLPHWDINILTPILRPGSRMNVLSPRTFRVEPAYSFFIGFFFLLLALFFQSFFGFPFNCFFCVLAFGHNFLPYLIVSRILKDAV